MRRTFSFRRGPGASYQRAIRKGKYRAAARLLRRWIAQRMLLLPRIDL